METCSRRSETDGNLLHAAFFMTFSLQLTRRPMFFPLHSILWVFCQCWVLFVCAGDKWARAVPLLTGSPGLWYYLQLQLLAAAWPPGASGTLCTLQPGTHKHLFMSTNRLTGDFTPVMSVLCKIHKCWAGYTRADKFLSNMPQVIFQLWDGTRRRFISFYELFWKKSYKQKDCVALQK